MKKLLPFFLLFAYYSFSQQDSSHYYTKYNHDYQYSCGFDKLMHEKYSNDIPFRTFVGSYENSLVYKTGSVPPTPLVANYTIPVVFHIITDGSAAQNITYQQIQWQLNALNAAFSNTYPAYNGQPAGPSAAVADAQIQFCLAVNPQLPAGNLQTSWTVPGENGVMRYTTTNSSILNHVMDNAGQTLLASVTHNVPQTFEFDKYLNIWVVPNICDPNNNNCNANSPPGIIGYGTFPGMNLAVDGIVMRLDCIGDNTLPTGGTMFGPLDQGKILAHEAGHYLGLYHTFETALGGVLTNNPPACYGANGGTCVMEGDLICDTPPTSIGTNACGNTISTCVDGLPFYTNIDQNDMLENYMCYSDDACMNTFTFDQRDRMWGAVDVTYNPLAARTNLVSGANLAFTGVSGPNGCAQQILSALFNYTLGSNSSCTNIAVNFVAPTGPGLAAVSFDWDFGDGTAHGNTAVISHTYATAGTFTVTLTTTDQAGATTSFSQVLNLNTSAVITGQSGTTVCKGSMQTVEITFTGTPPFSATLTDGVTSYTVSTEQFIAVLTIPVTQNVTFTLLPSTCNGQPTGSAAFVVVDCCPSLIVNGDFEQGNTGFISDLDYCLNSCQSSYWVDNTSSPVTTSWKPHNTNLPNRGMNMEIDGPCGSNCSGICTVNPALTPMPGMGGGSVINTTLTFDLWKQDLVVQPFTQYEIGFLSAGQNSISTIPRVKYQVQIRDAANGAIVFTSPVLSPPQTTTQQALFSPYDNWVAYNAQWSSPSAVPPMVTVAIMQVEDFWGNDFDYTIDDIRMQAVGTINAGPDALICPGTSAQLNAFPNCGTGTGFSYTWIPTTGLSNPNIPNPVASPTVTTTYTVIANGPNGSGGTATVTVFVNQSALSVTSSQPAICSSGGSVTLTATSSFSGATFTWYDQPLPSTAVATGNSYTTPTLTAATTYYVTSTINGCTSDPASITIPVFVAPVVSASVSPNVICEGDQITLSASGADNYAWSPAINCAFPCSTGTDAPQVSGTYTVIGSDVNGCVGLATVSVTVNTINVTITTSTGSNYACINGGNVMTALTNAVSPVFTWELNGTVINGATSQSYTATVGGTYAVTVYDQATGCSGATHYFLYPPFNPTVILNADLNNYCDGTGTSTLVVYPQSPGTSFQWYYNGTLLSFITGFQFGPLSSPVASGTYSVVVTDPFGCTYPSPTLTLNINPNPDLNLSTNGPVNLCSGASENICAISTMPGVNYSWISNGTGVGNTSCIVVNTPGQYIVNVTQPATGCITTTTVNVGAGPQVICDQCLVPNGDFEYYNNAPSNIANLSDAPFWSSATAGSPDYFNTVATNTVAGVPTNTFGSANANSGNGYAGILSYNTYEYLQTKLNCKLEKFQNYDVSFFYQLSSGSQVGADNLGLCLSTAAPQGTAAINASVPQLVAPGFVTNNNLWQQSFLGSFPGGGEEFLTIGNFNTAATQSVTVAPSGTIIPTYFYIDDVSVTPTPPSVTVFPSGCVAPGTNVSFALSGSPGYTITDGVNTYTMTVPTGSITVSPLTTTTYTITSVLGCVQCTAQTVVKVPVIPLTTVTSPSVCAGTASVTLTASGANTYTWSTGGTAATETVSPVVTTTYTVTGTDISGNCSSVAVSTVTVGNAPNLTVNSPSVCNGNSATLTANGAVNYSWSTGSINASIIVTPTVTTTYTVTGVVSGTCSATIVATVTVNGPPNVTVNSPAICSGQSATLIANGAINYIWSGGQNGNPITVNPSTGVTSYTVTGTDANGCVNSAVATVSVNPSPTVGINPIAIFNPICPGQSVQLIASGANTYQWTGSGLNSTNSATVIATPSVTTTYTVAGFNSFGCADGQTITVPVNPAGPNVTVSFAPTGTVCAGTPVIATASGAMTYTWTAPVSGIINPSSGPTVTITAIPGGTYTVQGSNGGCAGTPYVFTIPTQTISCIGNPLPLTISTNTLVPLSPISAAANTTYTVPTGSNVFVSNKEFRMGSGSKIVVKSGAQLTLAGCWLHSCGCLWQGIEVENGGILTLTNTTGGFLGTGGGVTIIEDAYTAVTALASNSSNGLVPELRISNTIFNKNYIDIDQQANANNVSVSYIRNCVFTCRSNMVASTNSPFTNNFSYALMRNVFLNNPPATISSSFPQATTAIGSRTRIGVKVHLVTHANGFRIGDPAAANYLNIFDNLDYGNVISNSNCLVKNNRFQNLTGNNNSSGYQGQATGIGVLAIDDKARHELGVGNVAKLNATAGNYPENTFKNNLRAMDINNYVFYAYNNSVDNLVTDHYASIPNQSVAFSGNGQYTGEYGVYYKNFQPFSVVCEVEANTIMNCNTGVHVNRNINYDATLIKVNCNTIGSAQMNYSGTQAQYCYQGILLQDVIGNPNSTVPTFGIQVRYNAVTQVYKNAILCENIKKGLDIRDNSELSTLYHPTNVQEVIRLNKCENAVIQSNSSVKTSLGNTTTGNIDITGIYVNSSISTTVKCNKSTYVGKCVEFENDCSNSIFQKNTMQNARVGLYMFNDARIGQQGAVGLPQGNLWGVGSFALSQSFADNINTSTAGVNTFSPIYIKAQNTPSLTQKPTIHGSAPVTTLPYSNTTVPSTTGIIETNGPTPSCLVPIAVNSCPTLGNANGGWGQIPPFVNANPPTIEILKKTLGKGISPFYGNEQKWVEENWVHNSLKNDTSLLLSDTVLSNFYSNSQSSIHEKFWQVAKKTLADDFVQARNENSNIVSFFTLDQSKKAMNNISLKKLEDSLYVYTPADSLTVLQIAQECPYIGGDAVYAARAWYNNKTNRNNYFSDNCPASASIQNRELKIDSNPLYGKFYCNIYPNPSDGRFFIEYDLIETEYAQFELFDLNGKRVFIEKLKGDALLVEVEINELCNGLYFFKITESGLTLSSGKISIQR
jgi:hypothetical protein